MVKVYCKKLIYNPGGWTKRQCTRKAWKDGYCKQHHPDTVAECDRKTNERYDIEDRIHNINKELRDFRYMCMNLVREFAVNIVYGLKTNKEAAKLIAKIDKSNSALVKERKKLEKINGKRK